jgi:hypothetical protein
VHHPRSICGDQREEDPRLHFALKSRVPDAKRFLLETGEMSQTRKQERIYVLGIVGPGNKSPDEDVLLLVTPSGGQIQQDPDIYPARRQFLSVELSAVDRKHNSDVVLSNAPILKCFYHVCAMEHVGIFVQIRFCFEFKKDARSFIAEVVGMRCALGISVQSLELRANGDGMEFLSGDLGPTIAGLESQLIVPSF